MTSSHVSDVEFFFSLRWPLEGWLSCVSCVELKVASCVVVFPPGCGTYSVVPPLCLTSPVALVCPSGCLIFSFVLLVCK